ncbi:ROK family transcriptional regulator [Kribbella albertanoniae]|uniref:ROK family transcriptional regulator n=1 Tax=Kribbella albertanoniae TaxID=1266829 RepID=A0A4V2XQT8_9ACTN|nr:ROK family transcriptional regulator [Kribbella albertanoniae]TDC27355.1 ROK family transcriptional regulator [Kribbella albertanoniae]
MDKTATSPLLRRMNTAAVLDVLRAGGPATGTELMDATGLSRPTVHALCDQLIALGWIHELESRRTGDRSSPGRRARQYEFNARAGFILGVDLGGEYKATAMLTDLRGVSLGDGIREFAPPDGGEVRLRAARRAIADAVRAAGVAKSAILVMGLAVPGPVNQDKPVVTNAWYLPGLAKVDLGRAVGKGLDCPVLVENDANLAVLAERWCGVAAGVDNVIELLAGERMGAGIYLGGNLIRGVVGGAGELELVSLLNGVVKPSGIGRLARDFGAEVIAAARGPRSKIGRSLLYDAAGGDPAAVSAEAVFAAARAGDAVSVDVVDRAVARIAPVLALLGTVLNPELIVISGGVADGGDLLVPRLEHQLSSLIDTLSVPRVTASTLGSRAVVLGAVRRALDHAERTVFADLTRA